MSLLIEGISIVTKKAIIMDKYRGGLGQYIEDCPNSSFCADEHLTAIMFQTLDDAYRWIRRLEIHGLTFIKKGHFADIAMVEKFIGPLVWKCNWLRFVRARAKYFNFDLDINAKISVCRMAGTQLGKLSVPENMNLCDSSKAQAGYLCLKESYSLFQFVEYEDGVEVFFDNETGEKICFERPFGCGSELLMSYDFHEKGFELMSCYLSAVCTGSWPVDSKNEEAQRNIGVGIQYLKESARLNPYSWLNFWYLGHAFQVIEDYQQAYRHFKAAYNLCVEDVDAFTDMLEICWYLGKNDEALSVTRTALNIWPDDTAWLSHLGEALIHVGQVEEAEEVLTEAFRRDPEDEAKQDRMELFFEFESEEGELP
jgi:hypothetical protein